MIRKPLVDLWRPVFAKIDEFSEEKNFKGSKAEMQKAASMASVLVLIFAPAVLIFGHPAQIVVN